MELKDLPEYLFHTPRNLVNLNLTGNLFSTIPDALALAINLEILYLDENPIEDIVNDK